MLVVSAAMIAPVSSKVQSLSVIAERITASCHSSGSDRRRTHSRQCSSVCSWNSRATVSTPSRRVSSGVSRKLTGPSSRKGVSAST